MSTSQSPTRASNRRCIGPGVPFRTMAGDCWARDASAAAITNIIHRRQIDLAFRILTLMYTMLPNFTFRGQEPTIKYGTYQNYSEGKTFVKIKTYNCPMEASIDVIGGKWKTLILWWLHQNTYRFAELRRLIPGITEKMFIQQLSELEADGMVARPVYATVPPKVGYSLTKYGRSLERALEAICEWGGAHRNRIRATEAPPSLGT